MKKTTIKNPMLEQFDKLKKHITTSEGKEQAKEFRKALVRSEKYSDALCVYLSDTLDGMEPEQSAKELKLL
jgi:(p)ppGpp synthase/HD superfamily hydrolase